MVKATRKRRARTARKSLARELSGIEGFNEGRKLRAQIIELGDKIRVLREDVLDITQTAASELIGIEQSELSRIENGVGSRGPSYSTITRIIEAYQGHLQNEDPTYHLGLNIQLRHGETGELEQSLLAGSSG
jgi:transcriptional regulator with XRE-family HTH domain